MKGKIGRILRRWEQGIREGLPWLFCCRTGDETGILDFREQKEKSRSTDSLPSFLAGMAYGLARGIYWGWGLG